MYILFDIGGTKMRIAGTRDLNEFTSEPIVIDTPHKYEEGKELLIEKMREVAGEENVERVAGGIAGPLDIEKRELVGGPNLTDWVKKPLIDDLTKVFGAPVYIENDAALVGLGEMHFGAGSIEGVTAYITVSTGVGGARYSNGRIDESTIGFEPGHEVIDPDKSMCPDCESGELESYIGGAATERRMGVKPYQITDPVFWDTYAKYLAYGLANIITLWSPSVVVLGGSMIVGDPAISISKTEEYLRDIVKIFPEIPVIKKAQLGDVGGLYGAMMLLKQERK